MKNLRYMFCFPQGGFNDFCQIIWNCLEYCINFTAVYFKMGHSIFNCKIELE